MLPKLMHKTAEAMGYGKQTVRRNVAKMSSLSEDTFPFPRLRINLQDSTLFYKKEKQSTKQMGTNDTLVYFSVLMMTMTKNCFRYYSL